MTTLNIVFENGDLSEESKRRMEETFNSAVASAVAARVHAGSMGLSFAKASYCGVSYGTVRATLASSTAVTPSSLARSFALLLAAPGRSRRSHHGTAHFYKPAWCRIATDLQMRTVRPLRPFRHRRTFDPFGHAQCPCLQGLYVSLPIHQNWLVLWSIIAYRSPITCHG